MTLQQLASTIAKREGKKSQARIGDIREILHVMCVLQAEAIYNVTTLPIAPIIEQGSVLLAQMHKRDKNKK